MTSTNSRLELSLKTLLDNAISESIAPGLVAIVFNRDGVIAQAVSGFANISTGQSMTLNSTVWLASMSKPIASFAALRLVEREGLDIDSHEQLVKILPELKAGSGEPVSKIFGERKVGEEGYEVEDAKSGITLRHLMSHTAGFGAFFTDAKSASCYVTGTPGMDTGKIASVNIPRIAECGEKWSYGCATDWLGFFVERVSGKTLPYAFKELVFYPLNTDQDALAGFCTSEMAKDRATIHAKDDDGNFFALPDGTVALPQYEGVPPEGHATLASAPCHGTVLGHAKFAQALLNQSTSSSTGELLISEKMWNEAAGDNLARLGLSLPPFVSQIPQASSNFDVWSAPEDDTKNVGEGWSLLQLVYTRQKSASGRQPGTLSWGGLANTYVFVDPASGVGGVIAAQFYPFADSKMIKLRDKFERLVYDHSEEW